jgi:hypothetical protein
MMKVKEMRLDISKSGAKAAVPVSAYPTSAQASSRLSAIGGTIRRRPLPFDIQSLLVLHRYIAAENQTRYPQYANLGHLE